MSIQEHPGSFVTWSEYYKGHLQHENQIAQTTQRLVDLVADVTIMKTTALDTNMKLTDHIIAESKTWVKIGDQIDSTNTALKDLTKQVKNPSVSLKTITAISVAGITALGELAYIVMLLRGH